MANDGESSDSDCLGEVRKRLRVWNNDQWLRELLNRSPVPNEVGAAVPSVLSAVVAAVGAALSGQEVAVASGTSMAVFRNSSVIEDVGTAITEADALASEQIGEGLVSAVDHQVKPEDATAVVYFLPPEGCTAGKALDHAERAINFQLGKGPTVFKIGITSDPAKRWEFYEKDDGQYRRMYVLYKHEQIEAACVMEAALIRLYRSVQGLQNEAKGGDGRPRASPCFTYVVVRHL